MKLNDIYWGVVVDTNDTTKSGKVKVKVNILYSELSNAQIPWAESAYQSNVQHDLPYIGEIVTVTFTNGDIHLPLWHRRRGVSNSQLLSDSDYSTASILVDKDLSKYNLDGRLSIRHTDSEGIIISLTRSDNESIINIRKDNTIALSNGSSKHIIHLAKDNISIGSENKSAEPAVLGDTNEEMLNRLNDFINELSNALSTGLTSLQSTAVSSPYTVHLSSPIKILKTKITNVISKWYKANTKEFIRTKSKIVTLD